MALPRRWCIRNFWQTHHWTVLAIEKAIPTAFVIGVAGANAAQLGELSKRVPIARSKIRGGRLQMAVHLRCGGCTALDLGLSLPGQPDFPLALLGNLNVVCVALELLAARTWTAAALPPTFWPSWFVSNPRARVAGLITKMLGHYTEALWGPFQSSTLMTEPSCSGCVEVVTTGPAKARSESQPFRS